MPLLNCFHKSNLAGQGGWIILIATVDHFCLMFYELWIWTYYCFCLLLNSKEVCLIGARQYLKLHNQGHMQMNYIFGKEITALPGSAIFHRIVFVPGLVTLFLSSPFTICRSWPLTADAEPPMHSADGLEMTLTFTVWEESQELHIHLHSLGTKQEANTT